jgi:hypothetical protein
MQVAVLLLALTRPALLTPWLETLAEAAREGKTCFRALTSVPLLLERWYRRARALPEHALLLAPGCGGMRQLLFRQRRLVFTRVIPAHAPTLAENLPLYADELDQTLAWLASQRLTGNTLAVRILAPAADLPALRGLATAGGIHGIHNPTRNIDLDVIDLAAHIMPIPSTKDAPALLTLVTRESHRHGMPPHYACPPLQAARRIVTARRLLTGATALLTASSLAAAGVDFSALRDLDRELAQQSARQHEWNNELRLLETRSLTRQPPTPALEAWLGAVEARNKAPSIDPAIILVAVGRLLAETPWLQLDTLSWQAATDPENNAAAVIIRFTAIPTATSADAIGNMGHSDSSARRIETLGTLWQRQHANPATIQLEADGHISFVATLALPTPPSSSGEPP